ncbi:MAG TPA: hypothetical protein VMQ61_14995 [Thermoanaerobaculia bacterium]|nr:hypothetical protein [Thermoanaerobaculia bacterium]
MTPARSDSGASSLVPALTLADLFGPGVVYTSRRSPNLPGWAPTAAGVIDSQTGNQLAIAGRMPYVASAGAVTPPALELLADAGLPVEADLNVYCSPAEYLDLLRLLSARGLRLATQRPHPAEEVAPAASLVRAELLCELNDKGRMEDLVPADWLPLRRLIEVRELPAAEVLLAGGEPVVLKAATALPSGGGHCVWVCRAPADVEVARAALRHERLVVIEKFLRLRRSVCVHAVVPADGTVSVVGCAEEVCGPNGKWLGNWLDSEADALPTGVEEVVLEIVGSAAARGFRGMAGIDVAFPEDGPPRVLDLNFRVNGSTAAVWLRGSIERREGARSMRLRGWACERSFSDLLRIARGAMKRRALIPLGLYDPAACSEGGLPRLHGILIGPSREAVREEERLLAREGLT